MNVYLYVYIYIYIYVFTYTYMYAYVYIYIHVYPDVAQKGAKSEVSDRGTLRRYGGGGHKMITTLHEPRSRHDGSSGASRTNRKKMRFPH